ncbi:MAG: glucosamine-6-phosphate deaminase [Tannerellaceae bacterium]|jgi:glucosamine-6-phosphate deaminase|nr:glucosamine-6-phosphate deaminase [Tannerellaceae bacterium]
MKHDLSSQITLTRIPQRYYRPENAFEHLALTRLEKVPTKIYETAERGTVAVAEHIARSIREKQEKGAPFVLAIPGGRSPLPIYRELIRMHKEEGLSLSNVHVFLEYEFYPLSLPGTGNISHLQREFFDHVDIPRKQIVAPDGTMPKEAIIDFCRRYEQRIEESGGIDCMLLGLGRYSNVMFNGAGTLSSTRTRLVLLEGDSRKEAARTFPSVESVPAGVITMGISTMMDAREVILIAWGEDKADIIFRTVEERESDAVPSSYLQHHPNAQVSVDLSAGHMLTRINHPWMVTNCEWDNKLIRRAIVRLCQQAGKPILKLTNKDYTEHGLGELLAIYGSAYNVNIRIFNDIQHTITGWPGGKPSADDTNRPERAAPYPKKVIIFSPHPDDDVISMGGTFRRLCDQHHDVYVAYETSGNIAVENEEVVRYCEFLHDVSVAYAPSDTLLRDKAQEVIRHLNHEGSDDGSPENRDVLFMKGTIRREEARHGARYSGIRSEDHIIFLDLPFYETGMVKKNPLSERDVQIVRELLERIQPNQIFVAGDLADPQGTHKVCLDAVLAAIDEVKDAAWMRNCWVWMYRGAWAEWEMDHIEMAVPISPEELRHKRNAILKHQSQNESAPYLGDDGRLFWQRAEDRNRATADLYRDLGLASYEAIEAFVRYDPYSESHS